VSESSPAPSKAPRPRRLRIAYVADVYGNKPFGAAQSSSRFVTALSERHQVTVMTTGKPAEGVVIFPSFYIPGARKLMEGNNFVFAAPDLKRLREVLVGFDVAHIQYSLPLGFFAQRVAKELGIPVIYGFHFQPENLLYSVNLNSERLRRVLYRFLVRFFYNEADHVICPSQFALDKLRQFGLDRPATVITNGLPEEFAPMEIARHGENKGKFTILMVGRLAREKRHDVVIEAIRGSRHARDVQLIVAGKGPIEAKIRELGRCLPNPPRVSFANDEELLRLYNTADLFIHASEVELEGMAVLEAIGCGLPALIADAEASASKQFALDSQFLFRHGDSADLRGRIDYLIDHRDLLEKAGRAYREKALAFSFQDAVRRTEAIYQQVARGRGRVATERRK
jgi:1,2-diacylglycerol 3-alpha-glucosyltransferase